MKKKFKGLVCILSCMAIMTACCLSSFAFVKNVRVLDSQDETYHYSTFCGIQNQVYRTIYYPEGQTVVPTGKSRRAITGTFLGYRTFRVTFNYMVK